MDTFRRFVQEAGRDPAKVPVEGRIPAARGGPEEWKRGVEAFREMGMTSVELTTMGAGYRALDEHLEALRRFREVDLAELQRALVLAERAPAPEPSGFVKATSLRVLADAPDHDHLRVALGASSQDLVHDGASESQAPELRVCSEWLDLDGLRSRIEPCDAVSGERPVRRSDDRHELSLRSPAST